MDSKSIIEKNRQAYNKIAEDWHEDHKKDDWWIEGTEKFASLLKPGESVLDGGCGGGFKSAYFLKRGLNVVGIDPSERMIEIARRENPAGRFEVLALQQMDKLSDIFDGIFMQASLLHIPKIEVKDVFLKAVAKLRKGGFLYVAVKEKKSDGPDEEVQTEEDYGYPYERFFSFFTVDEIRSPLKDLGCDIVYESITPTGKSRWIQMIGEKK